MDRRMFIMSDEKACPRSHLEKTCIEEKCIVFVHEKQHRMSTSGTGL
jgi:hypothetical protein